MTNGLGFVSICLSEENCSPAGDVTVKTVMKLPDDEARIGRIRRVAERNLTNTLRVLAFMRSQRLTVYRFATHLIPLATHEVTDSWAWWADPVLQPLLKRIGTVIRKQKFRVSTHPPQLCVLNSTNPSVFQWVEKYTAYHVRLFESMGLDEKTKIVLHVGRRVQGASAKEGNVAKPQPSVDADEQTKTDPNGRSESQSNAAATPETVRKTDHDAGPVPLNRNAGPVPLDRNARRVRLDAADPPAPLEPGLQAAADNVARLPDAVRSRLVIENDDRTYSARQTLTLCQQIGVPMVFDLHHHVCRNDGEDWKDLLPDIFATWTDRPPKFHLSSPRSESNVRAHADYVDPDMVGPFLKKAAALGAFDAMVEAKQKDLAALRLRHAFPDIFGPP